MINKQKKIMVKYSHPPSLSGNNLTNHNNNHSLYGSFVSQQSNIANQSLHNFKHNVLSNILMNYYRKNYKQLKNELLFKDSYIQTLNHYVESNKEKYFIELQPYIILLNNLEEMIKQMETIEHYETKYNKYTSNKEINISFTLPEIKILPEYEIYNIIYGKPSFKLGQEYNTVILNKIKKLLKNPNINFELLKQKLYI